MQANCNQRHTLRKRTGQLKHLSQYRHLPNQRRTGPYQLSILRCKVLPLKELNRVGDIRVLDDPFLLNIQYLHDLVELDYHRLHCVLDTGCYLVGGGNQLADEWGLLHVGRLLRFMLGIVGMCQSATFCFDFWLTLLIAHHQPAYLQQILLNFLQHTKRPLTHRHEYLQRRQKHLQTLHRLWQNLHLFRTIFLMVSMPICAHLENHIQRLKAKWRLCNQVLHCLLLEKYWTLMELVALFTCHWLEVQHLEQVRLLANRIQVAVNVSTVVQQRYVHCPQWLWGRRQVVQHTHLDVVSNL